MRQLVHQRSEQRLRCALGAAREAGGRSAEDHCVTDEDERARFPVDEEFHGHAMHRFGDDRIVDELLRRPAVLHGIGDIEKWLPEIDGEAVGGDAEDLTGVERVRGEATKHVSPGVQRGQHQGE